MSGSGPRQVAKGLALAAACFGLGRLGIRIHDLTGSSPLIWAPSGVALAALVLWGKEFWPWVSLGSLLTGVSTGSSLLATAISAVGATAGPWVGAAIFRYFAAARPTLSNLRQIGMLVLGAMGLGALVSSLLEVIGFYLNGSLPGRDFVEAWHAWWLGSAMGYLVVAGALIAWRNDLRYRLHRLRERRWEALFLLAAVTGVSLFLYTPLAAYNHSLIIRPYFLFSLMLWASLRFELLGATTTNLIVALSAAGGTLQGYSAFANSPPGERLVILQHFSAVLGITGLVLAAAMREKMEAVEARSDFLDIASHELKTPITSLKLQLQISLRRLTEKAGKSEAELAHQILLGKMDKQVNRLVRIVEQLLDVSIIERSNLVLQLEEVDLSTLARNLVERLANDLANARCEVELELSPAVRCRCDAFRIEQVLENILSNAIKYAPGRPIRITSSRAGKEARICIEDQGPGIERSKAPYIFDRFVRASRSPQVKGLGLGLFITRQIIEAHGGAISAESAPGQGTRFVISLPGEPKIPG